MFSVTQKCKWATRSNIESDGASIFSDVRNALCVQSNLSWPLLFVCK